MSGRNNRVSEFKCATTALALYQMHVDASDEELEELGVTRREVLALARGFDDTGGIQGRRAIAAYVIGKLSREGG